MGKVTRKLREILKERREDTLLTAKETAEILRVCPETLKEIDEKIRPYRVGKRRRYTEKMLEEYLEGSKREA